MYYFSNDYSEGAHKKILEALIKTNFMKTPGYGLDEICQSASLKLKKLINNQNADIHFVSGGTQANRLCLSAFLKSYEAIISPTSGHINVHETGAIEASGHKIITAQSSNGKIDVKSIADILNVHTDEHMVKPKLVFVTNATEIGTFYTKQELEAVSKFCHENNLYLYLDGARLANALVTQDNDLTLEDIANLTDAFYLGGTKNGALLGEAIVITNDELKNEFRFHIKQNGALLAKGRLLGIQFDVLLEDDLYLTNAKHANDMALMIQDALKELNVPLFIESATNQIFPIFPDYVVEELRKEFVFSNWEKIDGYHTAIRFVCSWATKKEDVEYLIQKLQQLCA